tara:strand:+ start:164 stop:943 length:780 start_codon:yes stop_codon:yes gene_type:complete
MKVTSWNVNSIRARLEHVLNWWDENRPDVLCLQETKVKNEDFPKEPFEDRGLHVYIHGQPAYNGVALISRQPLADVEFGFDDGDLEGHTRIIRARMGDIFLINGYFPQGESPDSPKFSFKRQFYGKMLETLQKSYKPTQKVLLCGDLNVAPDDIDVYDAEKVRGRCMFTDEEKSWLQNLRDWGLTDAFRHTNPDEQVFSWYDYRQLSYQTGKGWRIDHFWVTDSLLEAYIGGTHHKKERGKPKPSDHVPVDAEFKLKKG